MQKFGAILLLLFPAVLMAQSVIVDREVIGSTGALYSGNSFVDASIGESIIVTGGNSDITITQGFEQPLTKNLLVVQIETTPESCRGAGDGTATLTSITGCTPPYNVLWSNGNNGLSSGGFETGGYTVSIVTDACQTEISFDIDLESEEECRLKFYSGITPNDDGDNDYWHIDNIDLERYAGNSVNIFNRWGSVVWSGENYNNETMRWEGQGRNGGNLPDGTYFYVVEVNDNTHKGYIELTR